MLFFRSSQQRCPVKKGVLKNFVKLTGKHLYQSLFFNKVAGLKLWHRCFPVNFAKFLRRTFLKKNSVRLLLVFQFTSIIISKRWQRRLSIGTKKISCNKIRVIMPSLFLLKKVFNMICYYSFLTATTWIRFLQSVIFYEYLKIFIWENADYIPWRRDKRFDITHKRKWHLFGRLLRFQLLRFSQSN